MAYATAEQIAAGYRSLSASEISQAEALASEADIIIDSYNADADEDKKRIVECRMVRRALGASNSSIMPLGATNGSISALGYSQSVQFGDSGSAGELYITKLERRLLGVGDKIGSHSPLEDLDA